MIIKNTNNFKRKIKKNRSNSSITERKENNNNSLLKKRSKYLDNLLTKRIESQILLEKSKIDYYIDKYQNYKNFHRDYSIFYNDNILKHKTNYKFIKNGSLPNIADKKKNTNDKCISKNKSYDNKKIFPNLYKLDIHRPNFTNKYVNNKIHYIFCNRNNRNQIQNLFKNNIFKTKNVINSYSDK